MVNFNTSDIPDYDLNTSLIDEVINLYGVLTKFLVVEKINADDLVFGDYTHLKSDASKIYDMYMLPEISEDWDTSGIAFNSYGLTNFENIQLFVSKASIVDAIPDIANELQSITGNLIVLPNNKIMEITSSMWEVPGINNLFTYKDTKSVLKLTCIPYNNKLIQELDNVDIGTVEPDVPYETLDVYFNELIDQTTDQNIEAEVTPSVPTVEKTGGIDTTVQKPIVDRSEDDVFGKF
jgi:hypothetical protein